MALIRSGKLRLSVTPGTEKSPDSSKLLIRGDIDTRQGIVRLGEQRHDLRLVALLVALKEYDLNGKMRFLVKIAPHPLPNRNYFRIICNSSHPDCFAHKPPPTV